MKAVIYARYSSENQREESIEGQIRECKEYAEKNNIPIICNYIDRAFSARTADRPQFQKMIKDSESGTFDTILVWKLDRFSRDRYDSAFYKHALKKNGVKVISVKENITDTPEGIILEAMLEGMAEYYSAELSVKVKRGMKENAMKCKNNGANTPYGYYVNDQGYLAVDTDQAPIVKEIFTLYEKGKSITDIIKYLNNKGIRSGSGKKFTVGKMSYLLKNRKYIGEYKFDDVIIPGGIPAIIDEGQFERVQKRMKTNSKHGAKYAANTEYLLSTKFFCGTCGAFMIGECGIGRNDLVYNYYKCSNAKRKKGCHRKAVKKDFIEKLVVEATIRKVLTFENIDRIADTIITIQSQEDPTIPAMRRQLQECTKGIDNLINAIQAGIISDSTRERLEMLEIQRKQIETSIELAMIERPVFTKEQIVAWISHYKYGNVDDKSFQKEIIDTFVNSVYLYDDKLTLNYNYQNGTDTVSLDDIKRPYFSDCSNDSVPNQKVRARHFRPNKPGSFI